MLDMAFLSWRSVLAYIEYILMQPTEIVIQIFYDFYCKLTNKNNIADALSIFKDFANTVPYLIWTADRKGVFTYFNNNWLTLTGLNNDTAQNWVDYIHPSEEDIFLVKWNECVLFGRMANFEIRIKDYGGNYEWYTLTMVPLRDKDGSVIHWFGICCKSIAGVRPGIEPEKSKCNLKRLNELTEELSQLKAKNKSKAKRKTVTKRKKPSR